MDNESTILSVFCRWVEEFVGNPNHGHVALIDLIKDLVDHPTSIARKNTKKYAVLTREPVRYYIKKVLCVQCRSFIELSSQWFTVSQGLDSSSCKL